MKDCKCGKQFEAIDPVEDFIIYCRKCGMTKGLSPGKEKEEPRSRGRKPRKKGPKK